MLKITSTAKQIGLQINDRQVDYYLKGHLDFKLSNAGDRFYVYKIGSVASFLDHPMSEGVSIDGVDVTPDNLGDLLEEIAPEAGGAGGTDDHTQLTNRDAADQHPISAITGLTASLQALAAMQGNWLGVDFPTYADLLAYDASLAEKPADKTWTRVHADENPNGGNGNPSVYAWLRSEISPGTFENILTFQYAVYIPDTETDPVFTAWKGGNSIVAGANANASGSATVAIGINSTVSANAGTALGSNSKSGSYSVAIGYSSEASGNSSVAIAQSKASAQSSVAIGVNAVTSSTNSIALGANSQTTTDRELSIGHPTLKRRITNVADGTGNNDAATVGQVNATVAASQRWKPAVSTLADLPVITGTEQNVTWLCRVTSENNVYQRVAGTSSTWTLYSENTDYVDEQELEDAITEAVTGTLTDEDGTPDIPDTESGNIWTKIQQVRNNLKYLLFVITGGATGQVLTSAGGANPPEWQTPSNEQPNGSVNDTYQDQPVDHYYCVAKITSDLRPENSFWYSDMFKFDIIISNRAADINNYQCIANVVVNTGQWNPNPSGITINTATGNFESGNLYITQEEMPENGAKRVVYRIWMRKHIIQNYDSNVCFLQVSNILYYSGEGGMVDYKIEYFKPTAPDTFVGIPASQIAPQTPINEATFNRDINQSIEIPGGTSVDVINIQNNALKVTASSQDWIEGNGITTIGQISLIDYGGGDAVIWDYQNGWAASFNFMYADTDKEYYVDWNATTKVLTFTPGDVITSIDPNAGIFDSIMFINGSPAQIAEV
ncbi:hypothetical protein [Dysgonomonas termitidis]|uniref:Trimeric autotransporter adhesin YadA-like head domain-containing protein n=1 Tax=Dysgonomonas termitidis TaxID=1516126 RepID=A0ABV9KQ03_9BACT